MHTYIYRQYSTCVYDVCLEHVLVECVIRVGCTVDCSHYYFNLVLNNVFVLNWRRYDSFSGHSSFIFFFFSSSLGARTSDSKSKKDKRNLSDSGKKRVAYTLTRTNTFDMDLILCGRREAQQCKLSIFSTVSYRENWNLFEIFLQ